MHTRQNQETLLHMGWREANTEETLWQKLERDLRAANRRKADTIDWAIFTACVVIGAVAGIVMSFR